MKRLMAAALAVLWLSAIPLTALCAEPFPATVVLPYYQVWKTDVSGADDLFTYRWTALKGAPPPKGVTNTYWDWKLRGNTKGKLSLKFSFDAPGDYSYRLAAHVPKPVKGYTYEPRTYLLTVFVRNAPGGGLEADWNLLNEKSGAKVERIDLDPSYTSDHKHEKKSSKKSKSSSGSGKKSGKSAKTGDDSRIGSWAAILSASALMIACLIYEDLRLRREKRK